MIEYRLFFTTNKSTRKGFNTRKGPAFDSKEIAIEYGEKIRKLYGCDYTIQLEGDKNA